MKIINAKPLVTCLSPWLVLSWGAILGLGRAIAPAGAVEEARSPRLLAQSAEVGQVLFAQVGRLEPGDAQLADETFYDVYAFEGQAGAVLSMTLESLDFDAYLWLIAPNGEKLAENDDVAAGNLNSWLTVTLPTTGTYQIVANAAVPQSQGQYTLTVVAGEAAASLSPAALRQVEARQLNQTGGEILNQGPFQAALPYFEAALAIAQDIGDRRGTGEALNNMGFTYDRLGQYQAASAYYERALTLTREVGDRPLEGRILNNMGLTYRRLGNYQEALAYYERALLIMQALGDRSSEEITLNNIGGIYDRLGEYPQALNYYERSLALAQALGDRQSEGISLNNIGSIYELLGQYEQALAYYEQFLAIAQTLGDRPGEGVSLNNIGGIYQRLGDDQEALAYYERALAIARTLGDRLNEAISLNNIGGIYDRLGDYPQALDYHERSLNIRQDIGDRQGAGAALNNIGVVYDRLGQYPEALAYYERALAMRQEVGDRAGEATTLNNIGFNRLDARELAQAENRFLAAIAILESLRLGGLTEEQRISLVETQRKTFQGLQQALIAQNQVDAALEISERGRARVFLEELERRLNPEAFAQLASVPPPKMAQIRQIAQAQNATLVQYSIVRNQDLYIWVVQPTGATTFRQVSLSGQNLDIAELVDATRTSMGVLRSIVEWGEVENVAGNDATNTSATLNAQLQQLHQLLIDPIAEFLPADPTASVIFIPQDELFLVPFAALQDPDGTYLIDRHTILTAPAIQVLASTQAQQQQVRQANLQEMLVIGDPTMPPLSLVPGETAEFLQPLPGAEQEAIAIANLLDTAPLLGDAATKSAVVQQMPNARIIHLATHGILDESQGLNGGVVLAADGTGEFNDGLLTAAEIAQMDLNADLVVLSACNTGQGRITGDGVIGLSRSLVLAGVPSVVVSLWAVPDAPTGELMVEFYRQLEQTDNKAQALRQAMLNIREEYPNPIAWAAFTLIGEAE